MSEKAQSVKTIVTRIATDKPVRKTPYQVKGLIMREFPNESIVPFIDGSYRENFLYPRVQVKILNEQIYLVGIKEGVEPIQSIAKKLRIMNFGNITFGVEGFESDLSEDRFAPATRMIRYKFLTPWIALNEANLMKYKFLYGNERLQFLTRLLSQNIVFLAREMGVDLNTKIYSKLNLQSLYPKVVDDGKMGAFVGEYRANFILPNFLGVGNGITKGYGVIFSHFNPEDFTFDTSELEASKGDSAVEELPENWEAEAIDPDDVPRSRRGPRTTEEEPNYNKLEYHSRKF